MNICEAAKRAWKENKYISRKSVEGEDGKAFFRTKVRIKPTDTRRTCIAVTYERTGKEIRRCEHWSPTAEDLTAEDWTLVD